MADRKLTPTEEMKLMIIENFIDHYTTNDKEREEMKDDAFTYVEEDHVDEIKAAGYERKKDKIHY